MDILISPTQLRKTADNLLDSSRNISRCMHSVDDIIQNIGTARFTGQQADQLRRTYQSTRDQLLSAHKLVSQFSTQLETLAKDFENEDKKLASNRLRSILLDLDFRLPNIGSWIAGLIGGIGLTWPPRISLFPGLDLPRAPWNPKPVYAPDVEDQATSNTSVVTQPSKEDLPLSGSARTGKDQCFAFVKDQRIYNGNSMPSGMADKLYSGSYTGSGSFKDSSGKTYYYGQEPKLGAIMVESPKNSPSGSGITYGHMSIVSKIEKNPSGTVSKFTISETSWGKDKSSVHEEVFSWDAKTNQYISDSGRIYDCFVY